VSPALETSLVGLLGALTTVAISVGSIFGARKWNSWRHVNGRDRRSASRNGTNGGCLLATGRMPDSAMPKAALDYYTNTTELLRDIVNSQGDIVNHQERIAGCLERLERRAETGGDALIRLLERHRVD